MENNYEDTKITDEQAESIAKDLDEFMSQQPDVVAMNEAKETSKKSIDDGEYKLAQVEIDPNTGEHKILNTQELPEEPVSFEDQVLEKIENVNLDLSDSDPVNMGELKDALKLTNEINGDLVKDDISDNDLFSLLGLVNRRIKKENFNAYRELPEDIRNNIDKAIDGSTLAINLKRSDINAIKRSTADNILDSVKEIVIMERSKNDFANELTKVYQQGSKEIAESSLELQEERAKAYRDAAEKLDDEEKKAKTIAILDRIDDARSLVELKEFAKTCKIKPIELEKANSRVFSSLLNKYRDSVNNIYDINMALPIVYRNVDATDKEIIAFFIVFCKQIAKFDISNPLDHTYIYYVLYYCAMLDGDKTTTFRDNIKDVINNIKERNQNLFK